MRVLHLNTDDQAGAARSAFRLHQGLQRLPEFESVFVVGRSKLESRLSRPLEPAFMARVTKEIYSSFNRYLAGRVADDWRILVSFNRLPRLTAPFVARFQPDIIHLHWIGNGFLPLANIARFRRPVVWTMHDMWSFTGGCHYDLGCNGYRETCGTCPMVKDSFARRLVRWSYQQKQSAYHRQAITFIAPSLWLAECARRSSLLSRQRVEQIPYGLDLELFFPWDKSAARNELDLPHDKKILLFGAVQADRRKGLQHLLAALRQLRQSSTSDQLCLATFGHIPEALRHLGFPLHSFGRIHDDRKLTRIYAACDIFLAPSEQDNLPNTVLEAMACGVPCLAFSIGGMPDMIQHQQTGFLATPFDVAEFAAGVRWILSDPERQRHISQNARKQAETRFGLLRQAQAYAHIYQELLNDNG